MKLKSHGNAVRKLKKRVQWSLKNGAGFTLLELMAVVVIIGITIAGAVFYGQGTYRKSSVKNAARDVASLMRLAHSKALSERIYYNLVLDLDNENCYLEKHYSGDDGIWENIPVTDGDESDDNETETDSSPETWKKLAKVVDIYKINEDIEERVQRITFTLKETVVDCSNPYNTPDCYSVYLTDKNGTGNVQYLVTVDSTTARVKIYSSW